MQGIPLHVPTGQRLIVHKDHGVVLGVRLVGPRVHPARFLACLRAKPSNVVPTYTYKNSTVSDSVSDPIRIQKG
jgi:hypothetical protein